MTTCFFCRKPLQAGDVIDRHHIRPKRYCNSQEKRDPTNIAYCHVSCHALWHRVHDSVKWNKATFEAVMRPRSYGLGIFAGD